MVVRKVCEQYGLELLQDLPIDILPNIPLLSNIVAQSVLTDPIELSEDSYQDIMHQLS